MIAYKNNAFSQTVILYKHYFSSSTFIIIYGYYIYAYYIYAYIPSDKLGDWSKIDMGAQGLWSGLERTLCDVRTFHPGAPSYRNRKGRLYTSNMKTRRRTSTSAMCLRRRNAASLPSFSLHMVGVPLKLTSSTSE